MFGYSIPYLFGRLFGLSLFILGVRFLMIYRKGDYPKAALRQASRSVWVWFFLVLSVIGFVIEVVYLSSQPSGS